MGHHKLILDEFKNYPEKAGFLANRTMANNWSRAVLMNFIDTDLYERQGKPIGRVNKTLFGHPPMCSFYFITLS